MPIWLRRFNIHKINEAVEKQNKEMEKTQKGNQSDISSVARPNIPNKSSYSFKA